MSCPDWSAATAWRRGDGAAPPGWQEDLEHLEGCAACRRRVAELDPTLLLAATAAAAPELGDGEAQALRATVRSMMASERLARHRRPDRRALLAAAALVVLLAVPVGVSRLAERPAGPVAPVAMATTPPELPDEPPVEEVQPAGARVYQFGTEELPVVLIFDENLDL
ncbi:MAG: hypothetical protein ACE5EG_06855 [Thermoanaerobaculia bacterium]